MPEVSEEELYRLQNIERMYKEAHDQLDWYTVPHRNLTVKARIQWLAWIPNFWSQIKEAKKAEDMWENK